MSRQKPCHETDKLADEAILSHAACDNRTTCRKEFLDEEHSMVPLLEEEIKRLRSERDSYQQAFSEFAKQVKEAFAVGHRISDLWSELISKINHVSRSYAIIHEAGMFDIWTFLTENSLDSKLALAGAQVLMLQVFRDTPLDFLVHIEDREHPVEIPVPSALLYSAKR